MRIDAKCEKPVSWFVLTGGKVPEKWTKARCVEELVASCRAFTEIQLLAQHATKELQFNGSGGVFPTGALQGELVVDGKADSP